jgi:hypothetical protein
MNDFEFDIAPLQQVQPQLGRDTADLGIGRVAEEFERQERGAERVQRQVEKNQKMMLQNLETQAKNDGLKFDDMKKLANFSKTLTDKVVTYQQGKNEEKMQTGYMKAYTKGYSTEEMAKFKEDEGVLRAADAEARTVAADYERQGGLPDVAAEVRNMTGWEAYGYAKGLAERGGVNYSRFLADRWNKPVLTLNGKELTLGNASNSVEYKMAEEAHRQTYIAQYSGLNPKLLNEYLFPNMKKAEASAVLQWQKDFKVKQKNLVEGQALDALDSAIQANPSQQIINDWMFTHQGDLGGMYGAREKLKEYFETMIDNGKMSSDQVEKLFGKDAYFVGKNGNKIKMGSWREFQGLRQRALDYEQDRTKKQLAKAKQDDQVADQKFQDILEQNPELKNLTGSQKLEALKMLKANQFGRANMENTPAMDAFLTASPDDDLIKEQQILELIDAKGYVTPSMLTSPYLRKKFKGKTVDGEQVESIFKEYEGVVRANVADRVKLTNGQDPANNPEFSEGLIYANNRYKQLVQHVIQNRTDVDMSNVGKVALEMLEKELGEIGKYGDSPLHPNNYRMVTPKAAYLNTLTNAQEYAERQQEAGNSKFLETGLIPGTQKEYDELTNNIEKGGKIKIPQFYHDMARNIPGVTGQDVARAQLKAMGGPDLIPTEVETWIDKLPPEAQRILKEPALLTPNRLNRAEVSTEASDANPEDVQALLDYVVQDESGGNYNIIFGGRIVPGMEDMTIQQVIEEQRANVRRTGGGAVGKYQMLRPEEAAAHVGLPLTAKFTKENQDKMAMYYLEMAGYSRFMKGRISPETFARGLASQWAALHTAGGGSYYNDGVNKAGRSTNYQELLQMIRNMAAKSPYNAPQNISPSLR